MHYSATAKKDMIPINHRYHAQDYNLFNPFVLLVHKHLKSLISQATNAVTSGVRTLFTY